MSRKGLRRFIRRLADREEITYQQAIKHVLPSADKNLVYSLHKKRNKGKSSKKPKFDDGAKDLARLQRLEEMLGNYIM